MLLVGWERNAVGEIFFDGFVLIYLIEEMSSEKL